MPHPLDIIRRFVPLVPELENTLRQLLVERHFKRRQTISDTTQLSNTAFYIVKGAARVYHLKKGKEHTFSFAFDDQFILVNQYNEQFDNTRAFIEFLEPTTAITLSPERVREVVHSNDVDYSAATLFVNAALSQYCRYLEERVIVMQQDDAAARYRWVTTRYPRITDTVNGTQLASFLGITRETLYRIRRGVYRK